MQSESTSGVMAAEVGKPHLVPAHVIGELDDHIARRTAADDSRLQDRELTPKDMRILKGDAGEGRTYVDLLGRYERDRILHQPRFRDPDRVRIPDFAVVSDSTPQKLAEIVDSKAWSLVRPADSRGQPMSNKSFYHYLQENQDARKLLSMGKLQEVVEKYATSPRLEQEGKVVLYFPENVLRYAPQVQRTIEGWSGREIAHGHTVEVRSMGVWDQDLWKDVQSQWDS